MSNCLDIVSTAKESICNEMPYSKEQHAPITEHSEMDDDAMHEVISQASGKEVVLRPKTSHSSSSLPWYSPLTMMAEQLDQPLRRRLTGYLSGEFPDSFEHASLKRRYVMDGNSAFCNFGPDSNSVQTKEAKPRLWCVFPMITFILHCDEGMRCQPGGLHA